MTKICAIILAFSFLFSLNTKCQYYFFNEAYYETELCWEAGASVGGVNCLTDLGGKSRPQRRFINDVNWNTTRLAVGLYGALTYRSYFAARLEFFSVK